MTWAHWALLAFAWGISLWVASEISYARGEQFGKFLRRDDDDTHTD